MSGIYRQFIDDILSEFVAHLRQLFYVQFPQVVGSIYFAQEAKFFFFHFSALIFLKCKDRENLYNIKISEDKK